MISDPVAAWRASTSNRAAPRVLRRAGRPPAWLGLVALAVAVAFGAPLGYLVARNLAGGVEFAEALVSGRVAGPLRRSLLLAVSVAATAATLGTALAWLVSRTDLPGRRMLRMLLPLPLVIPSFIAAFAVIAAFAPGGLLAGPLAAVGVTTPRITGFWGAFAVLTLFTYPYVYLLVAARLRQLPGSLEESARLLGRGPVVTFWAVVWPQISGAVAAGALLVGLYTVADFGAVQLLHYDTLTRAIYSSRLLDQAASLALSLLLGTLAIAVVVAEQRLNRRSRSTRGLRGQRPLQVRLGHWKAPAVVFSWLVLALSLLAPMGVLAYWAVRGLAAGSDRAGALVTEPARLLMPALNTAGVSAAAAVVTTAVVLPVAYLTTRYRTRVGAAANAVVVGGFALPGLVIALSLVFWTRQAPLVVADAVYQTEVMLVFAYMVHFGSLALRAAQVAVASVPTQVGDAARVLGASAARRFLAVELPLMLPGLLAGAGLVLLSAAKELPATLLLAPPGFQTLATKVWVSTEDAFLADASVGALALIAVSGVLTWVLGVGRGDALD